MRYFSFNSAVKRWQSTTLVEASNVELGYVAGVTAPIQGQLDTNTPVGMLAPFAGAAAPTGWLLCAGQTVPRLGTYAKLFAVISTTYNTGGEAGTDFRLPDLRGRAIAGKDNMGGTTAARITAAVSGVTATTLGAVGGSESLHQHTHSGSFAPSGHTHQHVSPVGLNSGTTMHINPGDGMLDLIGSYNINDVTTGSVYYGGSGTAAVERWIVTSGGNSGGAVGPGNNPQTGTAQNLPPTMILNYIIKI